MLNAFPATMPSIMPDDLWVERNTQLPKGSGIELFSGVASEEPSCDRYVHHRVHDRVLNELAEANERVRRTERDLGALQEGLNKVLRDMPLV